MARYSKAKREKGLTEFQERVLVGMQAISSECEKCMKVDADRVGGIFFPGRSIAAVIGGKWKGWRHQQMLELRDKGWVEADLGFERGSSLKQVWRYSLTDTGRAVLRERMASVQKDCIWLEPQPE